MSREDLKKGIEIQARVDAAKMDKVAEGLEAQTAVLKSIEEGQGELRDTMDIVLEDMSAAEAKALYGLDRQKLPCEMDITERRVLCACVYTLLASYGQNSELQRLFYANLEQHLGVSERVLNFDLAVLEQIDSHTDRLVILKVICSFLFLGDNSFDFLKQKEKFSWLYDFCFAKDISAVCAEITEEYAVLGASGIAERYLSATRAGETEGEAEWVALPEAEEDSGFERLTEIICAYTNTGLDLGEPVELTEVEFRFVLETFPHAVAYDTLIAATKIANGYFLFTTHALYLKDSGFLKGKYVCVPYGSIWYDQLSSASGRKRGTRKLEIPYWGQDGSARSVTVDNTAVEEEKLLEMLLRIGKEQPPVAVTDTMIPLDEQAVEVREAFLSLLIYVLKNEGMSLLDAYVLAEKWQMTEAWGSVAHSIEDESAYTVMVDSFIHMIPYPSARIVAQMAMERIISVVCHNNFVMGKKMTTLSFSAERLIRALDVFHITDETFNVFLKRAPKNSKELTVEEYTDLKERVQARAVPYGDSIAHGVDTILYSIQTRVEHRARKNMEKAEQKVATAADSVIGKVEEGAKKTFRKISGATKGISESLPVGFSAFLQSNLVILDGGMGTLLQKAGLAPGELPERWNLTHADEVTAIHRAYFDAGSNVVNTNTFGANILKFSTDELDDIVRAAVENARAAAAQSGGTQEKFVALDIGPTGKLLKPLGDFDFEDAVAVFAETVKLGVKYGVDLITIETMNDSYETKAALLAVKENRLGDLPVLVSCAFGEDGKLMTGASPAAMVALLEGMGADAIGVNCSLGPKALAPVVREYLRLSSVPVLLKPNAGLPTVVDGETVYNVAPAEFAREVASLVHDGVRVAGGCCGTTPDYIAALTAEIKAQGLIAAPITPKHDTVVSSYTHAVTFGDDPALIGERINPTGKKRFKQALMEHDIGYILSEGIRQEEAGADILDVNVGLPEIDEVELLTEAVCELQAVTDLPLQIDTSNPVAMEAALRRYNGKAMINSVNGKEESLRAVLPLVKKYGGVVVALTLDENGIPDTAEGRVQIARRILAAAESYGIDKKDIIFDTLAMTVSASPNAANVTLEALSRIRRELDCHTSLGVSNISFGLPARDAINGTFFAMALQSGLSAAIMNPHSPDMMRTYHTYRALKGLDESFADYIRYAESLPAAPAVGTAVGQGTTPAGNAPAKNKPAEGATPLQKAIIKGLKEQAATLTAEMLASIPALTVVQTEIIPALDIVGQGFERKTTYLPQLLMAAEAAKAAFEVIKSSMTAETATDSTEQKMPIVLATVKGDIHDIGKNIVRLLLENYGYPVTDLGRDVPPEAVVEAAVRLHAPLVGLSALMTTTVPAMEETIKALRKDAPWCKIVVGGAVLTPDYASEIGADRYAADAMETVRYAEEISKNF